MLVSYFEVRAVWALFGTEEQAVPGCVSCRRDRFLYGVRTQAGVRRPLSPAVFLGLGYVVRVGRGEDHVHGDGARQMSGPLPVYIMSMLRLRKIPGSSFSAVMFISRYCFSPGKNVCLSVKVFAGFCCHCHHISVLQVGGLIMRGCGVEECSIFTV